MDPAQRVRLAELYVQHHVPEAVNESLWYSLDPPHAQVAQAADLLRAHGFAVVVSADAAPDLVAPWRSPTLTVIYTNRVVSLDRAGFVEATARGDASVILRQVADPSLLDPWTGVGQSPYPLAHPLQQVWDLNDLGGEDRREAADRLVRAVIRGYP